MGFRFFHTLLWVGGLFYGVVPFIWKHAFSHSTNTISWADNLGSGMLVFLGLAAIGSFKWGILARFINIDVQGQRQLKRWFWLSLGVQTTLSILGIYHVLTGYIYYFTGAVSITILAWLVFLGYGVSTELWPKVKSFTSWLVKKAEWNGVFYAVIFLILLWHNAHMVFDIKPFSLGYHSSLLINRIFNQFAIVGTLYLVIQFSIVAAPKWSRLLVWFVSSLIPIMIFADAFLAGLWNTNLVDFLNGFGVEGFKNIENEMKGGGIPMSLLTLILSAFGGIAVLGGAVYLMHWLSQKLKMAITPVSMIVLVAIAILAATLEQNIGKTWKQRKQVIAEENEFDVQLGISRKLQPLASFNVTFKDHTFSPDVMDKDSKKPNIFMIFIESFREDSLTKDITPFLHDFKLNEAQPIKRAWAGSNGTHLSWFGTFTGRVPIHWESDRVRCRKENWPGLRVFNEWKQAGYELQVYAPGELSYRDMKSHFFSEPDRVFNTIMDHIEADKETFNKDLSERERILLERFKTDISSRVSSESTGSEGGLFQIFCIDSPHFYYQWHKDFEPPFQPYYQGTYMPSRPSTEQLQLVKNKYYNALAWSDKLVKDYCQHLKQLGLYDDSIIIVMGDHGEEFQDNGGWLHVSSLENEQIRVPLLIKWPKHHARLSGGKGPVIADASHLDVLPSLLDFIYNEEVKTLAGISLLNPIPRSAIATTAQSGKTQEALMFANNGYKAYFKWPGYWNGRPTDKIYLSRITDEDGDVSATTPAEYQAILREHFGGAIQRTFSTFELSKE